MSQASRHCPVCNTEVPAGDAACPVCAAPMPDANAPPAPEPVPIPQSDDLLPGKIIDEKYQIVDCIGAGGFGDVYRVRHLMLHRELALKTLHPYLAAEPKMRERFFREARVLMDLMHPNLVTLRDVGQWRGLLYMVMDYCPGETLSAILEKRGRIPGPEAIALMVPVLHALDFAHRKGVVHRDLKPANLMVYRDAEWKQEVKVLDFGIAKLLDQAGASDQDGTDRPTSGLLVGTPQYMSPEQAQGCPVDTRSDIYSIGVILFLMVAGRHPFRGKNPSEIMQKILIERPPQFRDVETPDDPPGLEALLMQALAKKPVERPATAAEFLARLESLAKPAPAPAAAPSRPPPPEPAPSNSDSGSRTRFQPDPPAPPPPTPMPEPIAATTAKPSQAAVIAPTPSQGTTVRVRPASKPVQVAVTPRQRSGSHAGMFATLAFLGLIIGWSQGWFRSLLPGSFSDWLGNGPGKGTVEIPGKGGIDAGRKLEEERYAAEQAEATRRLKEEGITGPAGGSGSVRTAGLTYLGKDALGFERYRHEQTGIDLVLIPPGDFTMGTPDQAPERDPDERPHRVTLRRPFLVGRTEVTNAQYRRFRKEHTCGAGANDLDRDDRPVVCVSWTDAKDFCDWAGLRLPTEAEWEYAARGGRGNLFPWGNAWPPPADSGNFADVTIKGRTDIPAVLEDYNDGSPMTAVVGRYHANPLSLHDLAGNVAEWCACWYGDYPNAPVTDPAGPVTGKARIVRGGSWANGTDFSLRCARRSSSPPETRSQRIGFRVALSLQER